MSWGHYSDTEENRIAETYQDAVPGEIPDAMPGEIPDTVPSPHPRVTARLVDVTSLVMMRMDNEKHANPKGQTFSEVVLGLSKHVEFESPVDEAVLKNVLNRAVDEGELGRTKGFYKIQDWRLDGFIETVVESTKKRKKTKLNRVISSSDYDSEDVAQPGPLQDAPYPRVSARLLDLICLVMMNMDNMKYANPKGQTFLEVLQGLSKHMDVESPVDEVDLRNVMNRAVDDGELGRTKNFFKVQDWRLDGNIEQIAEQ